VILCPMLGKVIVLVRDDQLSLAIGRRGQNVRLASKLVGWDINVMTQKALDTQLDISIESFSVIPEMTPELAESLVMEGFFTFDDLSVIEPDQLAEISGLSSEICDNIIEFADAESLKAEENDRMIAEQRKNGVHREQPDHAVSSSAVDVPVASSIDQSESDRAESEPPSSAEVQEPENS